VSRVLLFLGAAFALGGLVILLAMLRPAWRGTARTLWRFYLSEFLIVGVFLWPAFTGGWWFLGLLLAMAARGQWELLALFGLRLKAWMTLASLLAGMALVATAALTPADLPAVLALAFLILVAAAAMPGQGLSGRHLHAAAGSLVFPVLPLAAMALLRRDSDGFLWLFLAQAVVETNDSFALLIGKLAGRRKILPRLSPGKTLEGLVAGLLAGGLAGFLIAHYLLALAPGAATLVTLTALAAGVAGDLLLSALKRARGVKDFRPLARLHGGLLDIYDSLLFAAPALFLVRAIL
jgi:phosphatidate cytidylyltransferase